MRLVGPRRLPGRGAVLELLHCELDVVSVIEVLYRAEEFLLEVRGRLDDLSRSFDGPTKSDRVR